MPSAKRHQEMLCFLRLGLRGKCYRGKRPKTGPLRCSTREGSYKRKTSFCTTWDPPRCPSERRVWWSTVSKGAVGFNSTSDQNLWLKRTSLKPVMWFQVFAGCVLWLGGSCYIVPLSFARSGILLLFLPQTWKHATHWWDHSNMAAASTREHILTSLNRNLSEIPSCLTSNFEAVFWSKKSNLQGLTMIITPKCK